MGLSRLSEKCRECKYVDTCEHKEMEALAYLNGVSINTGLNTGAPIIQPHDYRDIKINNGVTITIDLKESQRELAKSLYGNLMQFGG